MRSRHPLDRIRDDMLRGRQRHLFAALRLRYEVHREVSDSGDGSCTAPRPDRMAADLETERRVPNHLLRYIRAMGRW